ncbi:UvrD-helicase domain-containing protein [Nocardioides nitrophenolicus]|uniref:UvrD-helicase domain-containing protein n=1 Tax=Nocardioides nitrophenolicus TaxID=60489 RepID=UPI0027DDDE44|nr:UvrD-helicase domain-containing protein [Nocardioides nitrophenolicus]MBM7517127.1 exodeoxyribonuclease V beta subunit [Nocardioides nitrophenolicus]
MSDEMSPFDIRGPLPTGTTLLEASAGTGKTWTIGALVTRYVAEEGVPLEQLLVVTFGRAASQELREQVRRQLVEAEQALAGTLLTPPTEVIEQVLDCPPEERRLRHRRVTQALADFDAATIATIHQFCSLVLESLGVAGDTDARARLVEDLDDMLVEVVDDLYLRAFAQLPAGSAPAFTHAEALAIARRVVGDPQADLEPADLPRDDPAGRRVAFATAVRQEMSRRKRRLGVLSYDDLLDQLAVALEPPDSPARARMRARWRIVLVDEFQDTDPVQWKVFDRAFSGHATMVLIGDPKQAIYAFRGGDVTTYLTAAETATTRQTLAVNRRSDAGLVDCFGRLLGGAELGDPRIVVHDVAAHHQAPRLVGTPKDAPFRMRVVRRETFRKRGGTSLPVNQVRPHIARDLAHDIRALIASGATFGERALRPDDIAVICYRHADLAAARAALLEVGVPAVIAGGGSVFATPAAVEWLSLLEALEQPHRTPRVRAAALTSFLGYDAAALDAGGDELSDDLGDRLRSWSEALGRRGVAAVVEAATSGGMPERLLGQVGGERTLTDLRHIGEVLHEAALRDQMGAVALLAWLRQQVLEAREGRGAERTRRLDSDADAVQLVTIHASKGLQYPVVYLPSLADRWVGTPDKPLFHDAAGRRCLDVAGAGPDWGDHVQRWRDEDNGEWLRLLYVALTRAQCQVVAWWAPTRNAEASPLHRLLLRGPAADGPGLSGVVPVDPPVPDEDAATRLFATWRDRGAFVPEVAEPGAALPPVPRDPPAALSARDFTRTVDTGWRRTSYSALSHVDLGTPVPGVASEPEVEVKDDEDLPPLVDPAPADPALAVASPMAALPVGATFGSLVHAVLEHADPGADDLRAELLGHIDEQLTWWPVDLDPEVLADALVAVLDTPLGPLMDETTLRRVGTTDRLCELDFELPLSGGDHPVHQARADDEVLLGDIAALLRAHLPDGDPVRAYADALANPLLGGQALRGYLTGSIDVVLRLPSADGEPRYVVIDYKTNWLGPTDEPLTADAYRPSALDDAMGHSDYPLQALLYAVVLHRFLRWRQPGYDPARHLGGVAYLYLRGMCGPETPRVEGEPCGIFTWRPPVALVVALSDLLDGRTGS